jgi:hypothetical protein
MSTLNYFVSSARTRLADTNDQSYSDASWLEFYNHGQRAIALTGVFRQKTIKSVSSTSSVAFSALGSSAHRAFFVYRVDIGGSPIPFSKPDDNVDFTTLSAGTPTTWMTIGTTLYFNATYTGNYTAWYACIPGEAAALSEESALPAECYNAVIDYMCYLACHQDSDHATAQQYLDRFNEWAQSVRGIEDIKMYGGGSM